MQTSRSNNFIPDLFRDVFSSFSPRWLACVPLSALIVVVWHTAAVAQGFEAPAKIGRAHV